MLSVLTSTLGLTVGTQRAPAQRMGPPSMAIPFAKYHGLGNDFVLIDSRSSTEPPLSPEQAAKMCDRNFGIGADGVIFVLPADVSEAGSRMRIYNSDGSEPEMCGNGIRCMAQFLTTLDGTGGTDEGLYTISTLAGLIKPKIQEDGLVCVDMGTPILEGAQVPTTLPGDEKGRVIKAPLEAAGSEWHVTCVSMGNPHAVVFVDDLDAIDLATVGPALECHPAFPAKANIEFVQVLSRTHLKMKVWERGAGPTLACGTGACALAIAAALEGRAENACTVTLPGGDLQIEWRPDGDGHVYMTGPAVPVFSGVYQSA